MKFTLETLEDLAVRKLLKLDKYAYIMNNINKCKDITKDKKLQDTFNDFYAINGAKKSKAWKENYYKCFQEMLEKKRNNQEIKFIDILKKISMDDKVEFSFASKMFATLNPNMPIWDKNVKNNLKEELAFDEKIKVNKEDRINNANLIYERLIEVENNIINKEKETIIVPFRKRYKNLIDSLFINCELTDMKVLDFFLWMKRD